MSNRVAALKAKRRDWAVAASLVRKHKQHQQHQEKTEKRDSLDTSWSSQKPEQQCKPEIKALEEFTAKCSGRRSNGDPVAKQNTGRRSSNSSSSRSRIKRKKSVTQSRFTPKREVKQS